MHSSEQGLILTAAVGYGMQWLRAHRKFSDWAYYSVMVAACGVGYLLVRGEELKGCPDWLTCARTLALGLLTFVTAARGSGAMSKDMKLSPPANSQG